MKFGYKWHKRISRRFALTESSKSPVKQALAVLIFAALMAPALALLLTTTRVEIVAASPDVTKTENLWVDDYDMRVQQWNVVGTSPYLDVQDQPDSYVMYPLGNREIGDFYFSDLSVSGAINSAMLYLYLYCGTETIRVYLWDGSSWVASFDFGTGVLSTWQWHSENVSSYLDTYTKVNSAKIYLESIAIPAFKGTVRADAAYLSVNYTIPPPEKPILLDPDNGIITADTTPTFYWTAGAYAENHRIEIDDDSDFSSVTENENVVGTNWTPDSGLSTGTYYWRVWAINEAGENMSEDTWEFTITTWANANWQNRRKIEIDPLNPENYQMEIFFDNLSGMKSDLSDLRFLENIVGNLLEDETGDALPHWVQENNYPDNATVWVRKLENVDNSIYVYYSNPSTSSVENGDNVFILYDHFLGTSLDTSKWTETSGSVSVSDSIVTLENASDERLRSVATFSVPMIHRCKAKLGTGASSDMWLIGSVNSGMRYDGSSHVAHTNSPDNKTTLGSPADSWYVYEIRRPAGVSGDNEVKYYLDDNLEATHTLSDTSDVYIWFIADPGGKVEVDWAVVRKFADPEPTATVGEQEPPPVLPTKPVPHLPANTDTITDETPYFEWTRGKNADNHKLEVSTDNQIENIVWQVIQVENENTMSNENWLSDGKYYWKVTALSENGENASDIWSFTLKAISTLEYSSGVDVVWTHYGPSQYDFYELEMSYDGQYIALTTYGNKLRYFNGTSDNEHDWENDALGNETNIAMNENGQYLAIGGASGVSFYDNAYAGKRLWTSAVPNVGRDSLDMSKDGKYVVAGDTNSGDIYLFKGIGGNGSSEWVCTSPTTRTREIEISENGIDNKYYIIAASYDYKAYFLSHESSTPIWTYQVNIVSSPPGGLPYGAWAVAITENAERVAVGAYDNYLYVFQDNTDGSSGWSAGDNETKWTFEHTDNSYTAYSHLVYKASFSDDGQYLAVGLAVEDGWFYLFSFEDNEYLWKYDDQEVRDFDITPDGSRLVGAGWGGRILSWNRDDNEPIWFYGDIVERPGSTAISEDGSLVAALDANRMYLLQDGSFAYNLKTEGQLNPKRILTTTPEFSFKLPSRKVENTIAFRIAVGENVLNVDNLMWNSTWDIENDENEVYRVYAGQTLSPYTPYQWRVRLKDNENNWSPWSVTRSFEIVELLDFPYYRTITLTEDIPDNYQVLVKIENANNMNENFTDLLFYDSTYPNVGLPYWIENLSVGQSVWAWVKVHDNNQIKMAYGNSNAENASYGDGVFIHFDNFSGNSLDYTKWTSTGTPSVSNNVVTLAGDEKIWTKDKYGTNVALRTNAYITSDTENLDIGFNCYDTQYGTYHMTEAYFWGRSSTLYLRTQDGLTSLRTENNSSVDYLGSYAIYELKRIGTDNVELWANDDNLVLSVSTNITSSTLPVLVRGQLNGDAELKLDWIFLRRCLAVKPTVTVGAEETWGWEEIESWTGSLQNPAPPSVENLHITDMDNVAEDNLIPETQYKFWVEIQDNETLADIENVTLVVYLDNEDLPDNAVDHYTFQWTRDGGFEEVGPGGAVEPSVVGTSTSTWPISNPTQRKSFYANERFWVFYSDGTNVVYKTSTDGSAWSGSTIVKSGGTYGHRFSVAFDGTYVHYAYTSSALDTALYYWSGTPLDNGDITWSASEQTAVEGTEDYSIFYPTIDIDSSGYPWIGYRRWSSGTGGYPYVTKSSTNDGTWTTAPDFPYQLSSTADTYWLTSIIALTENRMLALYAYKETTVKAKRYDGSSWGTENQTTSKINNSQYDLSAVSQANDVHVVFLNATTYDVLYTKYVYDSNAFTSESTIQSGTTENSSPVLSIDTATNDLYCVWAGSPTANHIFYKKCIGGTWDSTPTDWIDESTENLKSCKGTTGFDKSYNNKIGFGYQTKVASPYDVKFVYLDLSSHLIVENCVAGDDTKTQDNFIFSIEFGENATVTDSDNWDVCVQVYDSAGNEDNRFFLNRFDIVSAAEWNLVETWTGTVEAPVAWELLETWTGTVEAPAAWQLIETWDGIIGVQAPAAWELIETWSGTIEAPVGWELVETWSGTVESPSAWGLIETWAGTVDAFAQWELIESWSGTLQTPTAWVLIESWDGTVQAPTAWGLIEQWSGSIQTPAGWLLVETWTGTVEAPIAWQLIETWNGTLEAFSGWQLLETWTGEVEAYSGWSLIETWTGTVENPAVWDLIETWSATVRTPAEWQLAETWTGTIQAPSAWDLIESWNGTIEAYAVWQLIETWDGTVQTPSAAVWNLMETWTGAVESPAAWQLIESWTGTVQAPTAWDLIETWSGTITAPSAWGLIETWTGTVEAYSGWVLTETWSGTVESPTEWQLIETWMGDIEAPAQWELIETWDGIIGVQAPAEWQLVETWNGTIESPTAWQLIETWSGLLEAPTAWQLIEMWSATVQAPTAWVQIESWSGTIIAPVGWELLETWNGVIEAPVAWQLVETWNGTITAPTAWQLIETWTGTIQTPSEWNLMESWSGSIQAPSEWSEVESWSGGVIAVGWQLIETWTGTIETHGWLLVESWTGSILTPAVYAVSITITPSENSGTLGDTLTYTVVVVNSGGTIDSYDLTSSDPQGWAVYLDNTTFSNVAAGEDRTTNLNVGLSTTGTHTINVTATGTGASDSDNCTAISATAPDIVQLGDGDLALAIGLMAIGLAICAPLIALVFIRKRMEEEGTT